MPAQPVVTVTIDGPTTYQEGDGGSYKATAQVDWSPAYPPESLHDGVCALRILGGPVGASLNGSGGPYSADATYAAGATDGTVDGWNIVRGYCQASVYVDDWSNNPMSAEGLADMQVYFTPPRLSVVSMTPAEGQALNAQVDEPVTVEVTISNDGPGNAAGDKLRLFSGLTPVDSSGVIQNTYPSVDVPPIPAQKTITFPVTFPGATARGAYTLSAILQPPRTQDVTGSWSSFTTVSVGLPHVDVLSYASDQNPAPENSPLTYTAVIQNTGWSQALGITLTDHLPPGVTFNSASISSGHIQSSSDTGVVFAIDELQPGDKVTATIQVQTPSKPGNLSSYVEVQTQTVQGPGPGQLVMSDNTFVGLANLVTTMTSVPAEVDPGATFTYMVHVRNDGPDKATNVRATSQVSGGTAISGVSSTGNQVTGRVTPSGATAECAVASLDPGSSMDLTLTATAPAQGTAFTIRSGASTFDEQYNNGGGRAQQDVKLAGPIDLSPLQLQVQGGDFKYDNTTKRYSATGVIFLGLKGAPFTPLLELDGTVSYDKLTIQANGTLLARVGGITQPLYQGGFTINVGSALTSLAGQLQFAGVQLSIAGLQLVQASDGSGPEIQLRGKLTLPDRLGGFALDVSGNNYVGLNANGLTFTGVTLSNPNYQLTLGGLKLTVDSLVIGYQSGPTLTVGGKFKVPQLGTTVDLSPDAGHYFSISAASDGSPLVGFVGQVQIDEVSISEAWSLKPIVLDITSTPSDFQITGSAELRGPDNSELSATLSVNADQGVVFTVTPGAKTAITVDAMTLQVTRVVFLSDYLNGTSGDFNPQLQLSGTLSMPVGLTGPSGNISGPQGQGKFNFTVSAEQPILIDQTGITLQAGELNLPGTYRMNLFGAVPIDVTNADLTFDTTTESARFQATLGFPSLNNATVNLSGANYVQLSESDGVVVVGELTIPGPINITGDGKWNLQNLELSVDTAEHSYSGTAVLHTPDSSVDAEVAITSEAFTFELTSSSGVAFKLLGMDMTLTDVGFTSNRTPGGGQVWNPELTLQGSLTAPAEWGGFTIDVRGDNQVVVNSDGVHVSGGSLTLPGEQTFTVADLLQVTTVNASLALDFDAGTATLQGLYRIPTFNNLQINLGGPRFVTLKSDSQGLHVAMNVTVTVDSIPIVEGWSITKVNASFAKDFDAGIGTASGTAVIQTPGSTLGLGLTFDHGRIQSAVVAAPAGVNFSLLGASVTITRVKFVPYSDASEPDTWSPELDVQGKLVLPPGLGNAGLDLGSQNYVLVTPSGVEFTGGKLKLPDVRFNLVNLLDVEATGLALEYTSDGFKIQGQVVLPQLHRATANFADPNYICLSTDDSGTPVLDVVGTLSVGDIVLVPKLWEVKDAQLTLDTTQSKVAGSATVVVPPGIGLSGTLGFQNYHLNTIGLGGSNLAVPIGTTGAFLQSVDGKVDNIASDSPLSFSGSVEVTAGPKLTVTLPSWAGGGFSGSLVDFTLGAAIDKTHLTGDGGVTILGGLATGNGHADLNWTQGFLSYSGALNLLGGLVTMSSSFNADSSLNLTLSGTATVHLPKIPYTPLGGQTISSSNGYFQYRADAPLSDDYVMGWGTLNVPVYGPQVLGFKAAFDGSYQLITNMQSLPGGASGGGSVAGAVQLSSRTHLLAVLPVPVSDSFDITPGTSRCLLTATWANEASNVAWELQDPDGNLLTQADLANRNDVVLVGALSGSTAVTLGLVNPRPGAWTLILPDSAGLGQVQFSGLRDTPAPTVTVAAPDVTPGSRGIVLHYSAANAPGGTVALYYNTTGQNYSGTLIADKLPATSDGSYTWDTSNLPAGSYYIHAVVQTSGAVPVFSAYTPAVQLTAPTGVIAGQVLQAGTATGLPGWTVFLDQNGNGHLDSGEATASTGAQGNYSFTVPRQQTYAVTLVLQPGLVRTMPAESSTQAITLLASGDATGVDFAVAAPGPTNPVTTTFAYTVIAGQELTVNAVQGLLSSASDPAGKALTAVLVSGPGGGTLTLNPDGSFNYQPNSGFVGTDAFTYQATDGVRDSAVTAVTVTVRNAPPSGPTNVVTFPNPVDGRSLTVTSATGTTLENVRAVGNPSVATYPATAQSPVGFFEFAVEGVTPGGATTVTVTLPEGVRVNSYYQYGPTADDATAHWYPFLFDGTTGAEIQGNVLTLHYVDGGRGDNDGAVNGTIVDPGSPMIQTTDAGGVLGQRFVNQLYQDMLGRSADPGGFAYWMTALEGGMTRAQVVAAFQSAPECLTQEVGTLYAKYLHRAADAAGLAWWQNYLQAGHTPDRAALELLNSTEYYQVRGGGTDNGFLQAAYTDLLGRLMDSSGHAYWSQQLAGGLSARAAVLESLEESTECMQKSIRAAYEDVLHRPADATGMESYMNAMMNGASGAQLANWLAASDEYFAGL